MSTASAPAKIILFGEHAVVYGRPALAVPVNQIHADVEILESPRAGVWIDAPQVNLHAEVQTLPRDHPIASVIQKFPSLSNATISINSTIPVASGLGSGAAVTVALIRALAEFCKTPFSDEQVSVLAYEIEKLHHGTPSGIDNTVITYNKPVYFIKEQPIQTFDIKVPFTIVIGNTGISAPTKESVADVRKLWEGDKEKWEKIFDEVGKIASEARENIERGKTKEIGALMNENHTLLQEMIVSSDKLDRLVTAAKKAGALGAKLSGGGRGGNMIALIEPDHAERVAESLIHAGAKGTIITKIS